MTVQLTKTQSEMVARLSPELRDSVTKEFLALNAEGQELRNRTLAQWKTNREVFSLKMGDLGNVIIYGLGQRFPVSLYPEQVQTFFEQKEAVAKFIADNKAELDKRYAARDVTLTVRKAEKAAKKAQVLKAAGIR